MQAGVFHVHGAHGGGGRVCVQAGVFHVHGAHGVGGRACVCRRTCSVCTEQGWKTEDWPEGG